MYTKYPCVEEEYYGVVVSAYGSQSRVMLPLNMETEDGTIYVNSKQYHGIIRRRQSRAKAASVLHHNKLSSRGRKVDITNYFSIFITNELVLSFLH